MSIEDIKDDIADMKNQINTAKRSHDQAEGAIKTYMKQLKDNHDLHSLNDAKKFIDKETIALSEMDSEIVAEFAVLRDRTGI